MSAQYDQEHFEKSKRTMQRRRDAHLKALPPSFTTNATRQTQAIAHMNASPKVKLNKIYALVDEYAEMRSPFVACRAGCDSCCHMNIQITNVEAERIARKTGRKLKTPRADTYHSAQKYAGVPCPFLSESRCSIYDERPLACRSHASFDVDSYWCEPERMNTVALPMISLTDAVVAVREIAQGSSGRREADIREFFD